MRQIINLSVLATLIVVAIALTFLIVDQSPTQIQGEGNPPMVTLDTWTLEMAMLQLPDDEGENNDLEGADNEGEDETDCAAVCQLALEACAAEPDILACVTPFFVETDCPITACDIPAPPEECSSNEDCPPDTTCIMNPAGNFCSS